MVKFDYGPKGEKEAEEYLKKIGKLESVVRSSLCGGKGFELVIAANCEYDARQGIEKAAKPKQPLFDWRSKIIKTPKRFCLKKNMWRESYIIANLFEFIVYKVAKGYPCKTYKIITKYGLNFKVCEQTLAT